MTWRELFPHATPAEWGDWRWQQRNALGRAEELARVVRLTDEERRGLELAEGRFRVAITPYYASLMDPDHPSCPVRMQAIPSPQELRLAPGDLEDPLGEEPRRPVRSVVHRYPDRALFLVGDRCAVYCRHCTRRRITFQTGRAVRVSASPAPPLAPGQDRPPASPLAPEVDLVTRADLEEGIAYVRGHREIRDVIVSGGDPLVLSDARLEEVLSGLRAIPHVEILRLATRAPVTCPMRITDSLAATLRRFAPLFVITHFNHPRECTPEAREACGRLVDHGVPVENQTVLLRGLNSSARILIDLNQRLLTFRVRPYYLHQGDLAAGTAHLRTPLEAGVAILEQMRGRTSGLAIPHLAVDLPGGLGKVTLAPDYRIPAPEAGARPQGTWFRSHRGEASFYPEPPSEDCTCPYEEVYYAARGEPRREAPETP
jgi:lysine 2,3-aminomutase